MRWQPETPSTNQLIARVLRFIDYNVGQYIGHRNSGDYGLAVQRLRRTRKLIALIDQAASQGCEMSPMDHANVMQVSGHLTKIGV